jgi:glycogen phosphorylase
MPLKPNLQVAYFTMEIALKSEIPTYAGGLGILAADLMRSCADMKVKAACVTIGWQHGYLRQKINSDGTQNYEDLAWKKEDYLEKLPEKISIKLENRIVAIGCWLYNLKSDQSNVPIYFLDTDLPENDHSDRRITDHLYGGDQIMRIKQEAVLGIGGVRMLRALGYQEITKYHMNEGHSAFLTLELLKEKGFKDDKVRPLCSFTTHTPVKAGHDVFDYDMAYRIMGDLLPWHIKSLAGESALSMTDLAMNLSSYTCGVSHIHGHVCREMFPGKEIDSITNGVHHVHWSSPEMQKLFDQRLSGWREKPSLLTKAIELCSDQEIWQAHMKAKKRLISEVNKHSEIPFQEDVLTIATARRVVPYKRPELLYTNLDRLKEIGQNKLQIIHAGNAHPNDEFSKGVIQRIIQRAGELKKYVRIVYLKIIILI